MELTQEEIALLRELGQYSFLPVARKASDMIPVYLENGEENKDLPGADMSAYKGYPVHGSIALTQRGQQVLELIEVQGIEE